MSKFSKSHYEMIAKVISEVWENRTEEEEVGIDAVVQVLHRLFKDDNPKFDGVVFDDAIFGDGV